MTAQRIELLAALLLASLQAAFSIRQEKCHIISTGRGLIMPEP